MVCAASSRLPVFCLLVLFFLLCQCVEVESSVHMLWPKPTSASSGKDRLEVVQGKFSFEDLSGTQGCNGDKVDAAIMNKYLKYIFFYDDNNNDREMDQYSAAWLKQQQRNNNNNNNNKILKSCGLCITDKTKGKTWMDIDERYDISIDSGDSNPTCILTAASLPGMIHALETFTQLIDLEEHSTNSKTNNDYHYILSDAPIHVSDEPRFAWRGLLLDSARHFMPVETICDIVEAMGAVKLNVLHWHIVDAQSFPYQTDVAPFMAAAGAYHWTAQYSSKDIETVRTCAKQSGVNVMFEFDMPGHSASWGKYYNITTNCPKYTSNINNVNLNPARNQTWEILSGLIGEVAQRYAQDGFLHLGGDEVVQDCWNNDPEVAQWMKANNMNTTDVFQMFIDRAIKYCKQSGVQPVFWDDPLDAGVSIPLSTPIEVWHTASSDTLKQILAAGYDVVYAGSYYLDVQIPNPDHTWYEWMQTWINFYQADPTTEIDAKYSKQILGGEAAMWSETTPWVSIEERIWPRAAAVAERYWSDASVNDVEEAATRLQWLSCHLRRRGVPSGALTPGFCLDNFYKHYRPQQ